MLFYKEKELRTFIEGLSENYEAAFDKIARLISQDLINVSYHYVANYEDAKDVSQEVLLKLYKKLRSFHHASKVSTWMYRIVVNACIDFLRKKKKTVSLEETITKDEKDTDTMIEQMEKKDTQERIKKGLEKLPLRQRNVIILKHFEGLKISEIGKILGCSQSSVKTHLYRAIENLRKELGGVR